MKSFLLFLFTLSVLHGQGQNSGIHKGYVIYSLGTDTTFIGYYQLHENNFEFRVMSRPNLAVTEMKGSFYSNGELKEANGYSYKPALTGEGERLVDYKLYISNDSTFVRQVRKGTETLYKYPGRAMMMNALGSPFLFFLVTAINYAPPAVGATAESSHFVLGQKKKFTIRRVAPHLLEAGSGIMGYFKIYLDDAGKLKRIDGIGSSWNVTGEPFDELDLNRYIKEYVLREEIQPLKPLTIRDSVLFTIRDAALRIDYSRPSKRGRLIFGGVVPWDRIWRTGANQPTKLTTGRPIYFNGKELAAGHYSIFTLPSEEGWTLIINGQTDMWGTDYDPAYDVMRIPMQTVTLSAPVEMMTIEISKGKDGQGVLSVIWDQTKAFVPFTVMMK